MRSTAAESSNPTRRSRPARAAAASSTRPERWSGSSRFALRGSSGSYYSLPVRWIRDRLPQRRPVDRRPSAARRPAVLAARRRDAAVLHARGAALRRRSMERADRADRALVGGGSARRRAAVRSRRRDAEARSPRSRRRLPTREAVELGPDVPSAWYGLALAYAAAGERGRRRGAPNRGWPTSIRASRRSCTKQSNGWAFSLSPA